MKPSTLITIATLIVVALVVGFCRKRDSDNRRDERIEQLEEQHVVDSVARVQAESRTDSLLRVVYTVRLRAARVDTLWRTRSTTIVSTVHELARDTTVADSVKVPKLVAAVDSLKAWGDSLSDANRSLMVVVADIPRLVQEERDKAARERATIIEQNRLLKKQSRHWGLGATLGGGITRLPSGEIIASAPQLTAGITYRW